MNEGSARFHLRHLEAAEILEEAADILITTGWTKGLFSNAKNERCALGAITAARYQLGYLRISQDFAEIALTKEIGEQEVGRTTQRLMRQGIWIPPGTLIQSFNDRVAQKVDEVTDKMLTAAKKLRSC
jgi:hypothetical protein